MDAVGQGPAVLHRSRVAYDGTVVSRPLSTLGTVCYQYWTSTVASAIGVLPQLAGTLRPVVLRTILAARSAVRLAPPATPSIALSVLLYVVGRVQGDTEVDGYTVSCAQPPSLLGGGDIVGWGPTAGVGNWLRSPSGGLLEDSVGA